MASLINLGLLHMPTPVPRFAGRTVLITGAGSGIGQATAVAVARAGASVVLTDINADGLGAVVAQITADGGRVAFSEPGDISDFEWVRGFGERVHRYVGVMDVVMNIAGIAIWGTVENLQHQQWRSVIDVNLMGPIHIIETFVPPMVRRGTGGQLVNVSSAAGLLAFPWHSAYSASKFGLRGISEVLRVDLRRHGIGVSLVCPGGVATPLVNTVQIAGIDRDNPAVQGEFDTFHKVAVSPEKAARAILAGVRRNRFIVYTSLDIRIGYWFARKFAWPYEIAMRVAGNRFTQLAELSARATTGQRE